MVVTAVGSLGAYLAARWQASKASAAAIATAKEHAEAARAAAETASAPQIIHGMNERLRDVTARVDSLEAAVDGLHSDVHVACRHIERIHDRCSACLRAKGIRIPDQLRKYIDPVLWDAQHQEPTTTTTLIGDESA